MAGTDGPADIAVVISCFNSGRTIDEAYESAVAQSRRPGEVLIVDDGSTDLITRQALARLSRHGARVVCRAHGGVARARNHGVALTVAPYIVLLDGDDRLVGSCLEEYAARLDASRSLAFVSCAVQAFEGADYIWKPPAVDAVGTLTRGSVHVSSMFRRTLWDAVGGFDAELEAYEDLDFWLRALRLGFRGEVLDSPLLEYRVGSDSRYRRALEPDTYQRTMRQLVARHRDFVQQNAIEILKEKNSFLSSLKVYHASLRTEHEALSRQLADGSDDAGGLILAYHRVAELEPDTHRLCVSPRHFREHLEYLRQRCTVLPLRELLQASRAGALPRRAVALTFDDGYLDALNQAAPLLAEHGLPATFFVNTDRLDEPHEDWHDTVERVLLSPSVHRVVLDGHPASTVAELTSQSSRRDALMHFHGLLLQAAPGERRDHLRRVAESAVSGGVELTPRDTHRLLTASEIVQLSRLPGCEIGSHTTHHLWLTSHSRDVQRHELLESRVSIETTIGRPVPLLAYPFGEHGEELESIAREVYDFGLTITSGLVTAGTDSMRVPRLEIRNCGVDEFAAIIDRAFAGGSGDSADSTKVAASPDVGRFSQDTVTWESNDARSRDELRAGALTLAARPQFLIIDPTSRCNARCVMCPVSFRQPGDNGIDLDAAVFAALSPLVATASHVNLFASGEPTIAKAICQMVDETKRLASPHTQIWLSTNGKHLPQLLLERLAAPRMVLQLSVDGGTRPIFEAIRRGIAFDELISTLEAIKEIKQRTTYPRLSFSCTISKRNLHDLSNIFRLAQAYDVDQISFYEEDPEVPEEEPFVLDESDRAVFDAQRRDIDSSGVPYANGLVFKGEQGLRATEPAPPEHAPVLTCNAPWKVFHQRADGTVRTCCTLRQSMGNLRTQTFDEVWNGDEYVKLRRAFVEQRGIPGTCYRCTDPLRTWGSP